MKYLLSLDKNNQVLKDHIREIEISLKLKEDYIKKNEELINKIEELEMSKKLSSKEINELSKEINVLEEQKKELQKSIKISESMWGELPYAELLEATKKSPMRGTVFIIKHYKIYGYISHPIDHFKNEAIESATIKIKIDNKDYETQSDDKGYYSIILKTYQFNKGYIEVLKSGYFQISDKSENSILFSDQTNIEKNFLLIKQ